MADFKERKVRVAFLPLNYMKEYLGEPGELMVDYNQGKAYIKSLDGSKNIEILGEEAVAPTMNEEIEKLLDGVSEDGNTLKKLRELLKPIQEWMEYNKSETNNGIVKTIQDIINKFRDMPETHQNLLIQIMNKVDKEEGKTLSTNDFTDAHLQKLNSIEYNANNYIHPMERQCNFHVIQTINGKTGKVNITKTDISGLENVEKDANYYIHPESKQCNYVFPVTMVNSRTGNVTINKDDVGLNKIENYPIATTEELQSADRVDRYVDITNATKAIKKFIEDNGIEPLQPLLTWKAMNNMITARGFNSTCGTTSAALTTGGINSATNPEFKTTEKFNGTSWSNSASMMYPRAQHSSTGTQTAALVLGIGNNIYDDIIFTDIKNRTMEIFNGTTWKNSEYPIGKIFNVRIVGNTLAAMACGGRDYDTKNGYSINKTFKYNGLTWTYICEMIQSSALHNVCGYSDYALSVEYTNFIIATQKFNKNVWISAQRPLHQYGISGIAGLQNSALIYDNIHTERYNGITWFEEAVNPNKQYWGGSCGNSHNAFLNGGYSNINSNPDTALNKTYKYS